MLGRADVAALNSGPGEERLVGEDSTDARTIGDWGLSP